MPVGNMIACYLRIRFLVKMAFVVVSLSLNTDGNVSNSIKRTAITEPHEGYRLNGKVINDFYAVSLNICTQKCLHHSDCKSINVLITDEKFPVVDICQLMSDDLQSTRNGLVSDSRWTYNAVKECDYNCNCFGGACFLDSNQCRETTEGKEYRGTMAKTRTGIICQCWNSQSPHSHSFTPSTHPHSGLEKNYCRNPDEDPVGPWCYTTSQSEVWDYCDIRMCGEDQCKNTTKGLEYRGITAKTRTGITCQDWEENFPHNHTFHESNYPNSGLVLNYCRNPDKDPGGPWCFTISESTVWDYCNTKMCDAAQQRSCLEIKKRLNATEDTIYEIYPFGNSTSVRVSCDMNTDSGGWTLISKTFGDANGNDNITFPNPISDFINEKNHFILSSSALRELQLFINFTQIRFQCFKTNPGREVDLATANNISGYKVVDYFIGKTNTSRPEACGSYEYFASDTSLLKGNCGLWGGGNKWSRPHVSLEDRLYSVPFRVFGQYNFVPYKLDNKSRWECDDNIGSGLPTVEDDDYWKIYVR